MTFKELKMPDALTRDFRLQEGILEEGLAKGIKKNAERLLLNCWQKEKPCQNS
ncbi:hypothetical protein KBC04_04450 [Candidatus Babeliales bacterium]|nr:hypothetical protein [Candidatus Babeliales bacterium]MBP9844071.1 hypothetical protein [Candidatus Babeliales bacterium]